MGYTSRLRAITYQPAARKALRRMPADTAKRIVGKIEAYATDPASQANNVIRMKGSHTIRLRVGDWRVVMEDGAVIDVIRIGPRGSVYGG